MANNKIQFKRTSTSGLLPNTTNAANSSFIDAGEFAVNLTDRKVVSSNGTATFEVGANLSSLLVTGSVTLNAAASTLTLGNSTTAVAVSANGSNGTSGQVLTSNGTSVYWSTISAGSFSNGTAYTWSAVQTFNANVAVAGNATSQLLVGATGANLIANGSTLILSVNSTANALVNSTIYSVTNSTAYTNVGLGSIQTTAGVVRIGNTGANVFANTTSIVVQANATQNAVINASGFYVNGALIGGGSFSNGTAYTWPAVQTYNANVVITSGNTTNYLQVGTTATNVAINSTAVAIGSAILSSAAGAAAIGVGNTAANVVINATAIVVQANATQNAVVNATGFYINGTAVGGGGGGTSIVNGTSNVSVVSSGGNVAVTVGGTANVAVFSSTSLVLGTGSGGDILNVGNVTANNLNGFVRPSTGTVTSAPILLTPGTLLSTPAVGAIEIDGNALYATENTTSGRGELGIFHQYRLTSDSSAFGPGITDFFPASSSIQLEASSIYEIDAMVWFLKTTAGTATWTWTNSSAASMIRSYYVGTVVTGFTTTIVTGTPITGYAIQQTSTALAHAATASLTTAVNHHYHFKVHVWTNAATNLRLRLTQSAGTATPRAGSYYTVRKISTNAGTFA